MKRYVFFVLFVLGCASQQRLTRSYVSDEQASVTAFVSDLLAGYPERQAFYDSAYTFCSYDSVRTREFHASVTELEARKHASAAYYRDKLRDLNHKLEILKGTAQ